MGELKIIIWVIIGIIYLISRFRKKPATDAPRRPVENIPEDKPVSFEDLLREIQSAKAQKQKPEPVLVPEPEFKAEDYDDDLKEEEEPLEKTDYTYRNQDSIYETYEKAKQEAFFRPSMEETLKLENTIVRFGQFKGYEQQSRPSLAREYGKELKDPSKFRKAFILSEILSRRF